MERSHLFNCLIGMSGLTAVAAGAIAAAQPSSRAPDQRREVAGWLIEDLADPDETDPDRRVIRMTRTVGPDQVAYEVYPDTEGWPGGFNSNLDGCFGGGGVDVEGELQPAERAVRTRAALVATLRRFCTPATASTNALLEGFEAAFPVLAERRQARVAELEAEYEQYLAQNAAEMAADAAMNEAE